MNSLRERPLPDAPSADPDEIAESSKPTEMFHAVSIIGRLSILEPRKPVFLVLCSAAGLKVFPLLVHAAACCRYFCSLSSFAPPVTR